ncbi:MAG: glycosyltransferase [Planctomycetota bacterium]
MHTFLVNLLTLDPGRNGGVARVAAVVGRHLARTARRGRARVVFAVSYEFAERFPAWLGETGGVVLPCPASAAAAELLAPLRPDVIVSPLFGGEPFLGVHALQGARHVAFMPDALALDRPELLPVAEVARREAAYQGLRQVDCVITSSRFSRARLIAHLGLPSSRVRVVSLGGDGLSTAAAEQPLPAGLQRPFLLYPANRWLHKRHALAVATMERIWQRRPELQLAVTGSIDSGLVERLAGVAGGALSRDERIVDLGFVSDGELDALYRNAEALLFCSDYEGFGMPVVEAMQRGCPVICSRAGSLPEVAGHAALYSESDDPEAWARLVLRELPRRRNALIKRGLVQARSFTWEHTWRGWRKALTSVVGRTALQGRATAAQGAGLEPQILLDWVQRQRALNEELVAKERVIQELKRTDADLARELAISKATAQAEASAREQLQGELAARESALASTLKELSEQREELVQQQHGLEAKEAVIQGQILATQQLEAERLALRDELQVRQAAWESQQLEEKRKSAALQSEVAQQQEALRVAREQLAAGEERVSLLRADRLLALEALEAASGRLEAREQELAAAQARLAGTEAALAAETVALTEAKRAAQLQETRLEALRTAGRQERTELQDRLAADAKLRLELETQRSRLEQEAARLRVSLSETETRLTAARASLSGLTDALAAVRQELAQAQASAQSEAAGWARRVAAQQQELGGLQAQLVHAEELAHLRAAEQQRLSAEVTRGQEQLARKHEELARLRGSLADAHRLRESLEQRLVEASETERAAAAEREELEAELGQVRGSLAAVENRLQERERDLATRDDSLRSQRQELRARESTITAQLRELAQRDDDLAQLRQELAAAAESVLERDRALGGRDRTIAERDGALAARAEELAERDRRLDGQMGELIAKEAVIQDLLRYRSWSLRWWWISRVGPATGLPLAFRTVQKVRERAADAVAPRLGTLYQYPPVPLRVPRRYQPSVPPSTALPSISLVTPSFNQAAFLERTIRSVAGQDYADLQYIVQDGGSTDGTADVLKRYAHQMTDAFSRKDRGQSHAINLGFEQTSGEIMAWLNSDDILLPGTLRYVAEYFTAHPDVDVVYGHRVLIDEHDGEIGRWVLPPHDQDVLSWADYVPQETLFWRRTAWDRAGGSIDESFQFAMDWDLLLRLRGSGASMVRLPRFLAAFRVHSAQKTSARINDLGAREMTRLRERSLGRPVSHEEIMEHVRPYLSRSVLYHQLWRLGMVRY